MRLEKNKFWTDFIGFALRGNVIELAIAIVIGGAFTKITSSLVSDILMPLINPLIPGGDWRNLEVRPGLRVGLFIGSVLDFFIIAFVLFLFVRLLTRLRSREL